MKRFLILATVVGLVLAMTLSAGATGNAKFRLKTFFGDQGDVTWQTGPDDQNLPVNDSPSDSNQSRLKLNVPMQNGDDYTGVYALGTGLGGKAVGAVKNLSFEYLAPSAGGYAGNGAPRFSIPLDTNGNGTFDEYMFMSAGSSNCPGIQIGASDWYRSDFTGSTALGCTIYENGVTPYSSTGTQSAWSVFAAAHPTYKVTTQSTAVAFIIQDEVGTAFLDQVAFQNHMFGGGPNSVTNCPTEASC